MNNVRALLSGPGSILVRRPPAEVLPELRARHQATPTVVRVPRTKERITRRRGRTRAVYMDGGRPPPASRTPPPPPVGPEEDCGLATSFGGTGEGLRSSPPPPVGP